MWLLGWLVDLMALLGGGCGSLAGLLPILAYDVAVWLGFQPIIAEGRCGYLGVWLGHWPSLAGSLAQPA